MKQLIAAQICAWIVSHASARRLRNYFDIACKLKFSIDANRLVYFSGFCLRWSLRRAGPFPERGAGLPYKSPWPIQGRGPGGPPPIIFIPDWGLKDWKNIFLRLGPPLISRSGWTGSPLIWRPGSMTESDRDARRKIKIKSLRETNVGLAFETKGDKAKTDVTIFFWNFPYA